MIINRNIYFLLIIITWRKKATIVVITEEGKKTKLAYEEKKYTPLLLNRATCIGIPLTNVRCKTHHYLRG
jgi:hypothetical protein